MVFGLYVLGFFSEAHPLSTGRKISRGAQRFPNIALFLKVCSYAHNLMHSIDRALILNILNELNLNVHWKTFI